MKKLLAVVIVLPLLVTLSPAADFDGDGTDDIAIFRPDTGLWAIRNISRYYFGSVKDVIVEGDFNGDGTDDTVIFRPTIGLWAARYITRCYWGRTNDIPIGGSSSFVRAIPTPGPYITPTPVGFYISTESLPEGRVGGNYETTLSAQGGVTPYAWSFQHLPPGLSWSDSGTISGIPEVSATYSVAVSVTDAESEGAFKTFALTITENQVEGISDLIGVSGDGKIGLAWINPRSIDFDEVKVLRKTGGYPQDAEDGTVIYEGIGDNIIDADLTNDNAYFYAVITYNYNGTPGGVGSDNRIEITPLEVSLAGENDPYADEVISFSPLSSGGSDPSAALGPPRGEGKYQGTLDVVSLQAKVYDGTSPCGGSIILKFNDNLVWNGYGDDFTIFENVFDIGGDELKRWMEPAIVAVSQDGKTYYTFPYDYVPHYDGDELDYYNPYSYMDGDGSVRGFAGIHPVFSNNGTPDPTNPLVSGGDSFDLEDITKDLSWIQYIKITATGDGWLTDRNGDSVRHVQDMGACSGDGSSGFDLDAVSAVNY